MAITTKTLTAFVFSIICIISYVDCHTTIASAPAPGMYGTESSPGNDPVKYGGCFITPACFAPGQYTIGCIVYCKTSHYAIGKCEGPKCCCYQHIDNASEVKQSNQM
ncbi:PREDICTED: defensin-like protein 106 [Camelina sativa]|uniref:Defensin-like protein 106 n=1 Tax=Camelina sativa TaxID=90675 RepID=A0ABM0TRJ7_CAMSA|nr:PREDICTED: defensin-like protein 106 [Camelina sativa]